MSGEDTRFLHVEVYFPAFARTDFLLFDLFSLLLPGLSWVSFYDQIYLTLHIESKFPHMLRILLASRVFLLPGRSRHDYPFPPDAGCLILTFGVDVFLLLFFHLD